MHRGGERRSGARGETGQSAGADRYEEGGASPYADEGRAREADDGPKPGAVPRRARPRRWPTGGGGGHCRRCPPLLCVRGGAAEGVCARDAADDQWPGPAPAERGLGCGQQAAAAVIFVRR